MVCSLESCADQMRSFCEFNSLCSIVVTILWILIYIAPGKSFSNMSWTCMSRTVIISQSQGWNGGKKEEMDWAEILQTWSKTTCKKGHYKVRKEGKRPGSQFHQFQQLCALPLARGTRALLTGPTACSNQAVYDTSHAVTWLSAIEKACVPFIVSGAGHTCGDRCPIWQGASRFQGSRGLDAQCLGNSFPLSFPCLSLTWSQRNPARLWTLYSSCYPCSKWWATAVACKSLLCLDFTLIIVSVPLQWVLVPTELKTLAG